MKLGIKRTFGLLAMASVLVSPSVTRASLFTFHVDVDTASLISNPNAPFYLDFQLNYGSGPFTNTATVSNFSFGGGAATGAANLFGSATGDLNGSVNLVDNNAQPFNELFQGFTPGSSLGFDVTLSANTTILTPDGFNFAILDNTTGQIPTSDPNSGLSLVSVDITGAPLTLSSVKAYTGVNDEILGDYSAVTVSVTAVPEPSSVALMTLAGLGLAGGSCLRLRKSIV